MTSGVRLVCALASAVVLTVALTAQSSLNSAKDLYASALYEAALSALNSINSADAKDDPTEVDTYRSLCFLALGRTRDAEATLEQIVVRKPAYMLDESEHSPRIVAMFRDVRRRALPAAAQQLYVSAKNEFDAKNYAVAATQFKQLLAVLDAPDAGDQAGKLADLKELAAGFLTLSEGRLAASAPAPAATAASASGTTQQGAKPPASTPTAGASGAPATGTPAPVASASPGGEPLSWSVATVQAGTRRPSMSAAAAAASSSGTPIYSLSDTDVTPPVVVDQRMPAWRIPDSIRDRTLAGRLEVVIDESGAVQEVVLPKPIWPSLDGALVEAAKRWRYQPARRQGQPVRYRRVIEINVDPRAESNTR